MNKAGLVEAVHAVLGSTKVQAEEVVEAVFGTITKTLSKYEIMIGNKKVEDMSTKEKISYDKLLLNKKLEEIHLKDYTVKLEIMDKCKLSEL